jgi:hypothetical protein
MKGSSCGCDGFEPKKGQDDEVVNKLRPRVKTLEALLREVYGLRILDRFKHKDLLARIEKELKVEG